MEFLCYLSRKIAIITFSRGFIVIMVNKCYTEGYHMTAKYCRIFIRPNTTVPFYSEPPELLEYISTNYVGECLTWRETSISDDGLIKECKTTWISLEKLELAKYDTVILSDYKNNMEPHCEENNIIMNNWIE